MTPHLLIDSLPEYHALTGWSSVDDVPPLPEALLFPMPDTKEFFGMLLAMEGLRNKIGELAHRVEIDEITGEQAKAELAAYLEQQEGE